MFFVYFMLTDCFETLHIWPLIGSTLYFRKHYDGHFARLLFRTFILKHKQEVALDR